MMMNAEEIIQFLHLKPLEPEGGWFRETYRATGTIPQSLLGRYYQGERNYATAIYYLLEGTQVSLLHRLPQDEVFHHYLGAAVEFLLLKPDGQGDELVLGKELTSGERPQLVIPGGVWQGARLKTEAGFALLGTTVAPGYDPRDFELGKREKLIHSYPSHEREITLLTLEPGAVKK